MLVVLLGLPLAVFGNGLGIQKIPFLEVDLKIDGEITESAWDNALLVNLIYETRPGENVEPQVKTHALLLDTGKSFAVAFRAYDPDPAEIRAYFRDRDSLFRDDFVGVKLDTFNDQRRALQFFVNPYGAQMDSVEDDVNKREDDSWDAIWESAGRITEFGYVVELEIPYTALSLPQTEGEKTWGIDVLRFYPRDSTYRLSNSPVDRNKECILCQMPKFRGFERAKPGRDLEITPTLVTTKSESREELSDPLVGGKVDPEFGLDVNWGVTSNITLNGTLNPDFSQVEADTAQLDVNQTFALFFPEKRPFFLENADYFDTRTRLVHTRNVADPDFGFRVTGKIGDGTFGTFFADDTVTSFLIPGSQSSDVGTLETSSNNGVVRFSRSLWGNSSLGVIGTARTADDYHNYVYGVDAVIRPTESDRFTIQLLRSQTEYPSLIVSDFEQPLGEFEGDAMVLSYNHEERNWFGFINFDDFDSGFRADLGFVGRVDFDRWNTRIGRNWYPETNTASWWNKLRLDGSFRISHDQSGQLLQRESEVAFSVQGPMQSYMEVSVEAGDRFWNGRTFEEKSIDVFGEFSPSRGVYLNLFARVGDQVDFANTELGDVLRLSPEIRWSLGEHWLFGLEHTFERLDRAEGELYTVNLSDLRIAYQFDLKQRLRLVVQYQDVKTDPTLYVDEVDARSRGLGGQLIYSYKVNPRTVLFAGYGESNRQDDSINDLLITSRTYFIKLSYAWEPTF